MEYMMASLKENNDGVLLASLKEIMMEYIMMVSLKEI